MIARVRLRVRLNDPPEAAPKPKPKQIWTPLRLNRNLMNYPLARSARTRPLWHEDKDVLWCTLPGESRIELSAPAAAPVRRLPTGFDMNVLFWLLAAVQQSQNERIRFASVAAFLREQHLRADNDNRARVLNSLELWAALTIRHLHWYERAAHVERNFSPPVRHVDFKGRSITVTLDQEWVRLANEKQYYEPIPLPLPQEAAAQNFVLLALTATLKGVEGEGQVRGGVRITYERRRRLFCRKIGLRNERQKLEHIAGLVASWFEARGGSLVFVEGINKSGYIVFVFTSPAVPRRKSGDRNPTVQRLKRQNPTVQAFIGPNPTVEGLILRKRRVPKARLELLRLLGEETSEGDSSTPVGRLRGPGWDWGSRC